MTDVSAPGSHAVSETRRAERAPAPGSPAPPSEPYGGFTRRVLIVAGIAVGAFLLWQLATVLLLAFASILLAIALLAGADLVSRLSRAPPQVALAIAIVLVLAFVAGVIAAIGGTAIAQIGELSQRLPAAVERLRGWFAESAAGKAALQALTSVDAAAGAKPAGWLANFAVGTAGAVGHLLLLIVLAIYLAVDPGLYRRGFLALVPRARRGEAAKTLSAVERALRKWLLGQFVAMLVVGLLTGIGLALIGVPYALALGLIAGVLEFVPFIGPIVAAIPAVLIAFSQSPMTALYVVLLYLAIQQIEGNVLMPLVQRWAVELPPALGVLAVVLFGLLFGLPGILLAVPLMVVVLVLVRELYVDDVLHSVR